MAVAFSVVYWCFVAISSGFLFLGALVIWTLTVLFDSNRKLLHQYTCWWATLYLRCLPGCRIVVHGREKIAAHAAYVLAANHQSMSDIMALSALHVPFKWVSKRETFRIPFIGWNMYLNRYVYVDRGNVRSVRATMEECRRWLGRGVSLMMFPEGHRSPDGEIHDFHTGAFKLAADAGCSVVPIVVNGTHPIYRGLRVLAFPGTIKIHVLDPITVEEAGGRSDQLRDLVARRMKEELGRMRGRETNPQAA